MPCHCRFCSATNYKYQIPLVSHSTNSITFLPSMDPPATILSAERKPDGLVIDDDDDGVVLEDCEEEEEEEEDDCVWDDDFSDFINADVWDSDFSYIMDDYPVITVRMHNSKRIKATRERRRVKSNLSSYVEACNIVCNCHLGWDSDEQKETGLHKEIESTDKDEIVKVTEKDELAKRQFEQNITADKAIEAEMTTKML